MTPEMPLADELAAVFTRVSGLLLTAETVDTVLRLITSLAKDTIPHTSGAGVTLVDQDGKRVTAAATDPVVERADALQYELGQGPCLTAWQTCTLVHVDDIGGDDRWPDWGQAMTGVGIGSVLSVPLVAESDTLGAMKVYAADAGAYGDREEQLLTKFATQAAIVLANMRTREDAQRVSDALKHALRGRDVIALGKGILMARNGVDEQAAFLALADTARRDSRTLQEAAEDLMRATVRPQF